MFIKLVIIEVILWCLCQQPVESTAIELPAITNSDEASSNCKNDDPIRYRLPNNTRPETYNLSVRTNVHKDDFDYDGNISINILIVNATREIILHSKNLFISSIRLSNATDTVETTWDTDETTDFLIITTKGAELLPGSRYRLDIEFEGVLGTNPRGFFRRLSDTNPSNKR